MSSEADGPTDHVECCDRSETECRKTAMSPLSNPVLRCIQLNSFVITRENHMKCHYCIMGHSLLSTLKVRVASETPLPPPTVTSLPDVPINEFVKHWLVALFCSVPEEVQASSAPVENITQGNWILVPQSRSLSFASEWSLTLSGTGIVFWVNTRHSA